LLYLTENGLDPTTFPSLLRLEIEVVRMVANLLRGDENVVGHVTSGGTESIILAVKTVRDKARAERPQLTAPEMVLPRTAHAAFHKAAHYLGIKPVIVDFDPHTFRADVKAMRAAINENTILLAASAPNYSQGVVDPIPEIGALAQEYGVCFHVDACVGGIHLSIMRELGYPAPPFDFTVPGVTSISADMHKYGYAAKGCSTILYRNKDLRRYQFFACTETTAYTLINSTVLSTKTGGPMAGAWAILNFLGKEGYRKIVAEVQQATQKLIDAINGFSDLRVLGKPDMCMFSFTSDTVDLLQLADEMRAYGWYLQPQFSTSLSPLNLHVSMNYGTANQVEAFLRHLELCLQRVRQMPPLDYGQLTAMVMTLLQNTTPDTFAQITALAGVEGGKLPERLAPINAVLEALPDAVANALLVAYFNELYV
jgi:glutamate/tyrosine decarboxylase-like PLP-dependent enzyme